MKYEHVFRAEWNQTEIAKLELEGIILDQFGIFRLTDEKKVRWIFNHFSNTKNFYYDKARAIFTDVELNSSQTLMLHQVGPNMVYPAQLSREDDGYDYLKYAFGDISSKLNVPIGEQSKPLTLSKEPKLAKKYIWGSFHGVSGYIFTDHERYEILKNKWGLGKREVLIGARQKVSKNFVQVEVPVASSPLCFGDSFFGKTFRLDGSGQLSDIKELCPESNRPLYTNQTIDFFPDFKDQFDFDIVFTQEWFGWYRRLVVSRKFADWMVSNKYITFDSNHLIPVKDFC